MLANLEMFVRTENFILSCNDWFSNSRKLYAHFFLSRSASRLYFLPLTSAPSVSISFYLSLTLCCIREWLVLIRLERFTSFSLSMAHIFTLALMLFVFMMFDCVKHEQHSLLPYPCSLSSLKPPKHGRAPAAATAEKNSTRTHTRLRYEYVYISRFLSLYDYETIKQHASKPKTCGNGKRLHFRPFKHSWTQCID